MTDQMKADLAALARALGLGADVVSRWLDERALVQGVRDGLPLQALAGLAGSLGGTPGVAGVAEAYAAWKASLAAGDGAPLAAALDAFAREFFFWLALGGHCRELAASVLGLPQELLADGALQGDALGRLARAALPGDNRPPFDILLEELGLSADDAGAWFVRFAKLFPHARASLAAFACFRRAIPARPVVGAFKLWNPEDESWSEQVDAADRISAVRAFLAAAGVARLPVVGELVTRRGRAAREEGDGRSRSAGFVALCGAMALDPDIYCCWRRDRRRQGRPASPLPLLAFGTWMARHAQGRAPTPEDVAAWQEELAGTNGAARANAQGRAVTAFLAWLHEMGLCEAAFACRRTRCRAGQPDTDPVALAAALQLPAADIEAWCLGAGIKGRTPAQLRESLDIFGGWLAVREQGAALQPGDLARWREELAGCTGKVAAMRHAAVVRSFLGAMAGRGCTEAAILLAGSSRASAASACIAALCPALGIAPRDVELWLSGAGSKASRAAWRSALASFAAFVAAKEAGDHPAAGRPAGVSATDVLAWSGRGDAGQGPAVARNRAAIVRRFFLWLQERGLFALPGIEELERGRGRGAARQPAQPDVPDVTGRLLESMGLGAGEVARWLSARGQGARSSLFLSLNQFALWKAAMAAGQAPTADDLDAWGRSLLSVTTRQKAARCLCNVANFFTWLGEEKLFAMEGLPAMASSSPSPSPARRRPEIPRGKTGEPATSATMALCRALGLDRDVTEEWRAAHASSTGRAPMLTGIRRLAAWLAKRHPGEAPTADLLEAWAGGLGKEVGSVAAYAYRSAVRMFFRWLDESRLFHLDRPLAFGRAGRPPARK